MQRSEYGSLIRAALAEDLGERGDVTSLALSDVGVSTMHLYSKDDGILAGAEVFEAVFSEVDPEIRVEFDLSDGARLSRGDHVASVSGPTRSILSGERTAINFLALLSGIATEARRYVDAAGGRAKILDTRKTLPGFRTLSKYAVRIGGAVNHRVGLYDMVLIKDNHIDEAGSIHAAVEAVRSRWGDEFRIEVECRTIDEVREALDCEVDVIMLDNMSDDEMVRCVALRRGTVEFEASGNMSLDRIPAASGTGVDSISVGALTHSVRAFDFSLKAEPVKPGVMNGSR